MIGSELELAIAHLLRAKELADFLALPPEVIDRIDLLKRATAKVRRQVENSSNRPA